MEDIKKIKKPATVPINKMHFNEDGILNFEIPEFCEYHPGKKAYVGEGWVPGHLQTMESGDPVWCNLDGDNIVFVKLINYKIDPHSGNYIGGEFVEVARFDICE